MSERFLQGTPTSLWYHFGPQGETRYLTNMPVPPNPAAIVDTYLYTAYGEPVALSGADRNPFQYGGQVGYYSTPGAGIVLWCGARWYNPYTARWMTRDPIGYAGGENLYAYCEQSPVGGLDPDGLLSLGDAIDVGISNTFTGAGAIIGFFTGGVGGGTAGSVVPVAGTAAGAAAGSMVGAVQGAAIGYLAGRAVIGLRRAGTHWFSHRSGGSGCPRGGGGEGRTPKLDRKKPILDQLRGSGQIRDLLHGPGWDKGVNAQDLARHSMDDLLAMRKRGEISLRTYRRFEKYFEGRDLSHGPTRR